MSRLQAGWIETKELSTALQDHDPLADYFNPILMSFSIQVKNVHDPGLYAPI